MNSLLPFWIIFTKALLSEDELYSCGQLYKLFEQLEA